MDNVKMMRDTPVWKLILKMGMPMIVIMIVQVVYNMADVFFMGQTGETLQVAAISLAGPAFSIFQGVGTLFGSGACTAIAIALGKGDKERVKYYSSFCVWASVAVGIVFSVLMLVFMDPLTAMLGADAETSVYAAEYLRIIAVSSPFVMFTGGIGSAIRADGSSAKVMLISLAGTFTNILLDPLFILVFGWGISGAAVATVLGNVVSSVLVFIHIRKSDCFTLSPKYFTLKKDISLHSLALGLPMAAGTVVMCFSSMFSNRLLVKYGNLAVAANGVSGKAGMLVSMIVMGVCMGIQPAISYAYGAADHKRLKQIVIGTGIATTALSTVLGIIFLVNREFFILAFLDDPKVLEYGKTMMLGLVALPVSGIYQLCSTYLQGTGKVSYATLVAMLQKAIIYIPVLYLSEHFFKFYGLVFSGVVTDVLSTAVGIALCLAWAKKLHRQHCTEGAAVNNN